MSGIRTYKNLRTLVVRLRDDLNNPTTPAHLVLIYAYMLSFLFLRYLSDNYETAAKKELGKDYPIGLPANLFYSTGIPVCILVLKKCKKPDDVLFINAAEHFVKGKRQNQLTDEHIAKIIDTYQFRKEEDRYSKRVGMELIAEEGYNLNISRYITTAQQQIEIDLSATHNELIEIEKQIRESTTKHNEFLKELGLKPLPAHD
jgi:type I restriction enzyme M protein